jgi:hypothetical protein
MEKNYFELVWSNPPRTTTKAQWKAASRWLRVCQGEIAKKIDYEKMNGQLVDAMIYGISYMN